MVHFFRLSNHIGANRRQVRKDRKALQRGQDNGLEHNTVVGQDGACTCGLDLGNEQHYRSGLDATRDTPP